MNSPLPTALGALVLVGVSLAATVGEHLDGVIRVVTLFTLLGTIARAPGFRLRGRPGERRRTSPASRCRSSTPPANAA
jgi:hypothetical protein